MFQIKSGWLYSDDINIRKVPVDRFGKRPEGIKISLIVIHCISLPPRQFGGPYVDDIFKGTLDPDAHPYFKEVAHLEVSTHLFINRQGVITQYVSFLDRAWHAGRSSYNGHKECNDYSIGIELEGCDDLEYTIEQYSTLKEVIAVLKETYPDIGNNIAGHNEVAPGRKTDPGKFFDWSQIR
ncbi:AmpD protein [Succinivibrio dextrinosolvens]|uniref:1,6-anhydro-N-acetylmuramyl-L-alanine amidase AmpD n=1 Tax=Succinivibrio dextrinosolvens TaxID=83771 RepID=UPI0008E611CA|nr:1,6-anhydro-N-acetylmuramyl-L-alanine amidase AmpD [Succinivibrio dextrinosolvens]SFS41417.1 AmpD protein [Succinivibrio dextrinosolvens]